MTLICMKMKLHAELIFIWKVSHLDSFWNRGTRELGNGLLPWLIHFFKNLIFTTLLQYIYSQKSRYCSDRELDNAIIHPATSLLIDYHYDCDNRIFVAIVISLLLVVKAWSTASLENPISTKVWTCKETRTKFMLNPFTKYHWFTVM